MSTLGPDISLVKKSNTVHFSPSKDEQYGNTPPQREKQSMRFS